MTTGRPPIRPNPDHEPPVVSGLGADERRVDEPQDDNEFLCNVCSDQDAIFGMEDGAGEELKASDEGAHGASRLSVLEERVSGDNHRHGPSGSPLLASS